eukprot:603784-Pleurochrysis_carterae.AAC.3
MAHADALQQALRRGETGGSGTHLAEFFRKHFQGDCHEACGGGFVGVFAKVLTSKTQLGMMAGASERSQRHGNFCETAGTRSRSFARSSAEREVRVHAEKRAPIEIQQDGEGRSRTQHSGCKKASARKRTREVQAQQKRAHRSWKYEANAWNARLQRS